MFMHLLTHNPIFSHRHVAMETTTALYSHCHMAKDKGDVAFTHFLHARTHTHTVPESSTCTSMHTHSYSGCHISPHISKSQQFINEITNCIGKQGVVGEKNDVMTVLLSLVLFLASFGVIHTTTQYRFSHRLCHNNTVHHFEYAYQMTLENMRSRMSCTDQF